MVLDGKTLNAAAGIQIKGQDKLPTIIQNASSKKDRLMETLLACGTNSTGLEILLSLTRLA
jgi:hypothetical protein